MSWTATVFRSFSGSSSTLENKVYKLAMENTALKQRVCEHDGTIRCLRKELREAQPDRDDGEMQHRTLMTMAQELVDHDAYIKKLESQLTPTPVIDERTASSYSLCPS